MANAAGMLKESIWRDKDFRALPRGAQATYAQLLSQKDLDRAGMQPLQVSKWAKGCDEVTEADIWHDLKVLEERRFVFVDEDTDELFVRSYMRHSEVTKYPQYLKAAIRCAGMVASPILRHELANELRRLRRADATAKADEIDPDGTVPEPFENPSGTLPEPLQNGAGTVNPSGTLPERWGVGERVGVVTSRGGSVGEAPPKFCPKHMPDGTPDDCGACGGYRRHHDRWLEHHAADVDTAQAAHRSAAAQARADCRRCDDAGWTLDDAGLPAEPARRCTHEEHRHA